MRWPGSVGIRPAETWGLVRRPASARSLRMLRMVAGLHAMGARLERVRLPTGSPVSTKRLTTARRISWLRNVRSVLSIGALGRKRALGVSTPRVGVLTPKIRARAGAVKRFPPEEGGLARRGEEAYSVVF